MNNQSSSYDIVKIHLQRNGSHNRKIKLKKKSLFDAVEETCKLSSYEVREAFIKLQENGEVIFPFPLTHEDVPKKGTMKVNLPPLPKEDHQIRWEKALNCLGLLPAAKKNYMGLQKNLKIFLLRI